MLRDSNFTASLPLHITNSTNLDFPHCLTADMESQSDRSAHNRTCLPICSRKKFHCYCEKFYCHEIVHIPHLPAKFFQTRFRTFHSSPKHFDRAFKHHTYHSIQLSPPAGHDTTFFNYIATFKIPLYSTKFYHNHHHHQSWSPHAPDLASPRQQLLSAAPALGFVLQAPHQHQSSSALLPPEPAPARKVFRPRALDRPAMLMESVPKPAHHVSLPALSKASLPPSRTSLVSKMR